VVGLVRGIHGLRGAVRLEVLTDDPGRFEPGALLYPEGRDGPLTVEWSQEDGPGILIRFRERPDRVAVEPLRDCYLEALVTEAALPRGSWYWHEVTGARVTTSRDEDLGTVTDIFRTGGSEVFVVEGPRGEVLIPAVGTIIVEFAPAEGRIVVDADVLALDETESRSKVRGRRTTRARRDRERGVIADPSGQDATPDVVTTGDTPTSADVLAGSATDPVGSATSPSTLGEVDPSAT